MYGYFNSMTTCRYGFCFNNKTLLRFNHSEHLLLVMVAGLSGVQFGLGSPICLITSMITDQTGWHKVLLSINHNFNTICNIIGYFFKSKHKKLEILVYKQWKKSHLACTWWHVLSNYLDMTCTVLLNCPIKAEIRAVDSQSDLTIFL